tara:strand:- start:64 stop:720 length:657 start_codon:yes stop_codon:yes gene_type:complete
MTFNVAIPGQSLTDEPKNFPWERPPEIADPDEAVRHHLTYLSKEEAVESTLFVLESGLPITTFVSTLMTNAVGNGIHSIDVGLLIAPTIHEAIKATADEGGVNYKEEFSRDTEKDEMRKERETTLIRKALMDSLKEEGSSEGMDEGLIDETAEALGSPDAEQFEDAAMQSDEEPMAEEAMAEEAPMENTPMEEAAPEGEPVSALSTGLGQGLMSREAQ